MIHSNSPPLILLPLFFLFAISVINPSSAHDSNFRAIRTLKGIKETPNGGNITYDCSPSGPCIPCSRSEKRDKKYRCGETGYRIRLKCVPTGSGSKDQNNLKEKKTRSLLETTDLGVSQHETDLPTSSSKQRRLKGDSSKSKGGLRPYLTYRSCIPAVNEEKLSVLGFEALMMAFLISSGSFIYFRRKRASAVAAGGVPMRIPTSSRF